MPDEIDKSVLNGQKQHWEGMLGTRPEMLGLDASAPARRTADLFEQNDVRWVLELGGGQGRDSLFLAARGFNIQVLDYAQPGVEAIRTKALQAGLADRLTVAQHDVRKRLPFADASFDGCYSHMLFCMAFTEAELRALSQEDRTKVERVAKGYELVAVEEFEEGKLPRRLFRVTLRKPER